MGKLFARVGSAAMLAGASLFVIGGQAHVSAKNTPTPPDCGNAVSNSTYGSLDGYWVSMQNNKSYCEINGHAGEGGTVTVHLTFGEQTPSVKADTQSVPYVTLASYVAPDNNPSNLDDQVLSQCATTNSAANPDCTGGTYNAADQTLTVKVPDCGFQVDFAFGPVVTKFDTTVTPPVRYNQGAGHDRLIDSDTGKSSETCGGGEGSPTPPTSTPSGGVLGSSTTPTPTTTGAVQGISTPSTGAAVGSSLGTDLAAFALLFLGFGLVGLARRQPVELS